jgi:chromosome partitioning protein
MREYFGQLVFDTVIHRNTKLAEAPSAGQPVLLYDPVSKGATEYKALAEEILSSRAADQTQPVGVGAALDQENNNVRG